MAAAFSKLGPLSVGASVDVFSPHIEELHSYFKTRGMGFGSPEDLKPFVERVESDANFRDEVGSLMRTIIYRERDGLSWAELMELLAAAVGGPGVAEAEAPAARTDMRRLMVFVEGVFRTRRNPGAVSAAAAPVVVLDPEREERKGPETVESAVTTEEVVANDAQSEHAELPKPEHPATDRFYRARGVAEAEEIETLAEERGAEDARARMAEDDATEPETVLHTDLNLHIPFEDFGDRQTVERGSPAWLWMAGICALLLAFCGGLFVHQQLIVPLRAPNTPYEAPPQEAQKTPAAVAAASTAASAARTAGAQDAGFVTKSTPGGRPGAASVPVNDVTQLPRYMAPATVGASPAVMAARLVYAPPPAYPMMAEMTRTQGKVTVEAVVGKSGRVIRARAIDGHRLLRKAAVREVLARRYRPYTLNDRPANVATIVTVDFKLKR